MIETIKPSHSMTQYMECVSELMNGDTPTSSIKSFYDKIVFTESKYQRTYVYTIDNKIAATCTILFEYKLRYAQPKAYIEDVSVHPDYRGKDYGREIVAFCMDIAEKEKCYKIVLTCKDELIPYYESLGFKKDVNFMVKTDPEGYNKV